MVEHRTDASTATVVPTTATSDTERGVTGQIRGAVAAGYLHGRGTRSVYFSAARLDGGGLGISFVLHQASGPWSIGTHVVVAVAGDFDRLTLNVGAPVEVA